MAKQINIIGKSERRPGFKTLQKIGLGLEYLDAYENSQRNLHTHDYIEMSYILSGKCFHELEGQQFTQTPGTLSIINLNQSHSLKTDGVVKVVNIYLDIDKYPLPSLPDRLNSIVPTFLSLHPNLTHKLTRIIQIKFSHPEIIESLLNLMKHELAKQRESQKYVLSRYFEIFLTECCRQILADKNDSTADNINSQSLRQIETARLFINENFNKELTLNQISRQAGYQPNYFCRIFREYTGLPLFEYIIHRRIEQAMILLRSTDNKILSIAYDCGFNDLSHFNRCFKKTSGLTPREYRQVAISKK
jgi:AraC-like DNA-binding protein